MCENYSDFGDEIHVMPMVSNWRCPQCGAIAHDNTHKCGKTYEQLLAETPTCPVCFTSSWQPCLPYTPHRIPDPTIPNSHIVCGYCRLEESYRELRKRIEKLLKETE